MRALRKLVVLALLGIGLILIPQFQSLERMGARRLGQHSNAAPTTLTVGVSWPFSALGDGFAQGVRLGADLAQTRHGMAVHLTLRDDGDDWDTARRIALDFADTPDMDAVVGYHDPDVAIRAAGIFQSARLLHLITAPLTAAPLTATQGHDLMIRLLPPVASVIDSLAGAVPGPYAVVSDDGSHARQMADMFHVRHGEERRLTVTYRRSQADFGKAVISIGHMRPQSVLFLGHAPEAKAFLTQLRRHGITIPVLLPMVDANQMQGPGFDNTLTAIFYDPAAGTKANSGFRQAFRARYGHDPDSWAALGYDAILLLAQGAADAGSDRPRRMAPALHAITGFEGAAGPYDYDRNGVLENRPFLLHRQ